jgi:hypothetical protein
MMNLKDLSSIDKDEILKNLGLQSYRSAALTAIPGIALFGLGVLVGAGVGMLFAPKTGQELRDDISERVGALRNRAGSNLNTTSDTEVRATGLQDLGT